MKNNNNDLRANTPQTDMSRRELVRRAAGLAGLALAAPLLDADAAPEENQQATTPAMKTMPPMKAMPKHDMSGYGIPTGPPQQIAMLIYPQMTTLDLIGPQQIFSIMGNVEVHLVAKQMNKPVVSDSNVPILPTKSFADCPDNLTILFVPGGSRGVLGVMQDDATLDFLARKGKTAQWITSVCTGSLILGAAGLLKGYKATSHWSMRDEILPIFGATPVKERVVEDRNRMTGAGITAGIDFGLRLAAKLRNEKMARAIQLGMEYDPQPPYHAGTLEGAGADVKGMMLAMYYPLQEDMKAAALRASKRKS